MVRAIKKVEFKLQDTLIKKRVAAYARVSSGKDAMLESLSAQVSYYSQYIQARNDWEYVGVYADEATTGTKDDRAEFQRLLSDCRAGKIDMIITKSISRLARNTVTMLETVRKLKTYGIDIFFEKENIHSMDEDGEVMLTILASYAQEESLSVSENCKWRIRKQFEEGRPSSTTIMGYKLVDGAFEIIPEEAEIVKMIFTDYLNGMGKNAIVKKLRQGNFPTKCGGAWNESVISDMLRNEKYVGDLLLQKSFSSNHITKKKCKNEGQLPMYYVRDNHVPIIDRATFDKVQVEIAKRAKRFNSTKVSNTVYPYTGKIVCEKCGKHYRRKINNAGSKYERVVWICTTFDRLGKSVCSSQQIPEDILLEITEEDFIEIRVPKHNTLHIVLKDGSVIEKYWEYKSRKDSWTDEMKQKARERNLERRESLWQNQLSQ